MADHTLTLSNGRKLGYAEFGDPKGEVAFYFHGWPSSRVQGSLFDEPAKKHGMRLICPDRPGIGLSDFQLGRTLFDWPETFAQLAAHVGADNYHIIGWSGGGPYVLVTALKMPKRLLSASIICGAPPLKFLGDREMFWLYRFMIQLRHYLPTVLGTVLRLGGLVAKGNPQKAPLRWLLKLLGEEDRRVLLLPGIYDVVRDATLGALNRGPRSVIADADIYLSEWGFEVSQLNFPIRFWHGKQDRNIAWTYTRQIAELIPQAETHWSEIDGHYSLPITHAEQIITAAMQKAEPESLTGK
ncbi:alpha/beta hydrolase [Prosthecobacter sp.]|uniref:alpha/beta fold hydrolase n=1 Tax=Prosthecobacter sp. TaxID=1965333 RepID=UPI001DCEC1C6|nr:alpha/beta hydrolase [Prosthecobacter sp.]MCB1279776.1 alpha/beta hydrolase [Prosthecobacter sp.]